MGEFEFDVDTRLSGEAPEFEASLGETWSGVPGVNGGFMLAPCTRALARVLPFPDPLVVSGFDLRPGSPGPARVSTEAIRAGETTAFGEAALWRDGKQGLRTVAAFTDLAQGLRGSAATRSRPAPRLPCRRLRSASGSSLARCAAS